MASRSPKPWLPLRVFFPGKYGMKKPKWLTRIEFVDKEYLGYWEYQGWSKSRAAVQSVTDDPHDGANISGANFVLTGWAIANENGMTKVEVSTDGGRTWSPRSIFSNPSPSSGSFWKYVWANPAEGKQPSRSAPPTATASCKLRAPRRMARRRHRLPFHNRLRLLGAAFCCHPERAKITGPPGRRSSVVIPSAAQWGPGIPGKGSPGDQSSLLPQFCSPHVPLCSGVAMIPAF